MPLSVTHQACPWPTHSDRPSTNQACMSLVWVKRPLVTSLASHMGYTPGMPLANPFHGVSLASFINYTPMQVHAPSTSHIGYISGIPHQACPKNLTSITHVHRSTPGRHSAAIPRTGSPAQLLHLPHPIYTSRCSRGQLSP